MGNRKFQALFYLANTITGYYPACYRCPLLPAMRPMKQLRNDCRNLAFHIPLERIAMGVIFSAERCMAAGLPSLRAFLPL